MGSSSQPSVPAPPDYAKLFKEGIDAYVANFPKVVDAEQQYRHDLDPQRIQDQQTLQSLFGPTQYKQQLEALNTLDPGYQSTREALRTNVTNDLALGTQLTPAQERLFETQFRGAQVARGNTLGTSAGLAETIGKANLGQQMYQERLGNVGNYLAGATPEQQLLAVQGVTPDRSLAYVNPSAGSAAANFGLSNYSNLLAQYQLAGGGSSSSPWSRAIRGAGIGASQGSIGGPWGAVGGAAGGFFDGLFNGPIYQAQTGSYSDERLKTDIREIAKT